MSTRIFEVYDALKEAGASEEKAKSAAEVTANYNNRFDKVEKDLSVIKVKLSLIQWLVGSVGFAVLLLVVKSFL